MQACFIKESYSTVVEGCRHYGPASYLQSYLSFKLTLEEALNIEC